MREPRARRRQLEAPVRQDAQSLAVAEAAKSDHDAEVLQQVQLGLQKLTAVLPFGSRGSVSGRGAPNGGRHVDAAQPESIFP
jgi:hypothetical protein